MNVLKSKYVRLVSIDLSEQIWSKNCIQDKKYFTKYLIEYAHFFRTLSFLTMSRYYFLLAENMFETKSWTKSKLMNLGGLQNQNEAVIFFGMAAIRFLSRGVWFSPKVVSNISDQNTQIWPYPTLNGGPDLGTLVVPFDQTFHPLL